MVTIKDHEEGDGFAHDNIVVGRLYVGKEHLRKFRGWYLVVTLPIKQTKSVLDIYSLSRANRLCRPSWLFRFEKAGNTHGNGKWTFRKAFMWRWRPIKEIENQ